MKSAVMRLVQNSPEWHAHRAQFRNTSESAAVMGLNPWQSASAGEVPRHYEVQVQHQLMVSGAALAHLWVFDGTEGGKSHATKPPWNPSELRGTCSRSFWIAIDPKRPLVMLESGLPTQKIIDAPRLAQP